jgi:hypothetical protein
MHVRVVIVRNSYRLAIVLQLIGTAGASFFKANPFLSQDLFHFFRHSKLHYVPYCNTGKKYDFFDHFYRCCTFYAAIQVRAMHGT